MIHVPDQLVLLYEEDGQVVGAFIGEEDGDDSVFLSWSIVSIPGSFPRALVEAIEHARPRWKHVSFYIPDKLPRAAALARLAQERYGAEAVEADERGVLYRLTFKEARNGRIAPEAERAEAGTRPGS